MKKHSEVSPFRRKKLKREDLLAAVEAEINDLVADSTSSGWNYWVIIGALGTLVWLAIDGWNSSSFSVANILMLTLASSLSWDVVKSVSKSVDQPFIRRAPKPNTYKHVSRILGAARSTLLFHLLRYGMFCYVAWTLSPAFLAPVIISFTAGFAVCGSSLCISYCDLPPQRVDTSRKFRKLVRWAFVISVVVICSALTSSWGYVWIHSHAISAGDLRLALLCSAIIYLISIAVQNRVSEVQVEMLRSLRKDVLFGRISLAEAQSHLDLLYIGTTFDRALQPKFAEVIEAFQKLSQAIQRTQEAQEQLFVKAGIAGEDAHNQDFKIAEDAMDKALDEVGACIAEAGDKVSTFKTYHLCMLAMTDMEKDPASEYMKELDNITARIREQADKVRSNFKNSFARYRSRMDSHVKQTDELRNSDQPAKAAA